MKKRQRLREFDGRACDFVEVPLKRERFSLEVKYLSYLQNKKKRNSSSMVICKQERDAFINYHVVTTLQHTESEIEGRKNVM
jgi:hypothetical protein